MHEYLPAVGFSDVLDITGWKTLLEETVEHYDDKMVFETREGRLFAEIYRETAPGAGLCVCGEFDENNVFYPEYLFPYLNGRDISTTEEVHIERRIATEDCECSVDDLRVGATLIFYLRNLADFEIRRERGDALSGHFPTELSGFSLEGTILLPLDKKGNEEAWDAAEDERKKLIQAAQSGDAEAMESLTMGDYETYNQVMERAGREDVLTIVDSYFMPNGSECDRYAILGEIESWEKVKNKITGEDLIMLVVMCNGIRLTVCINELDLQGEPEAGRRFRGIIWLQGYVHFPDLSK